MCVYLPHCHANLRTIFFPKNSFLSSHVHGLGWCFYFLVRYRRRGCQSMSTDSNTQHCSGYASHIYHVPTTRQSTHIPVPHTHTHTECQPCFSRFIVCSFVVFRMQAQLSYAMKIAMCTWGIFCGYARRVHVTQPFYFGTVMAPLTIVCVCVVSYHSLGNCISEISHHEIKRKVKSHKIRKIKEEKNERIKIE